MRQVAKASAPAKVILLGEHFVVHGCKALVSAINLRAKVICSKINNRKIRISSGKLFCEKEIGGDFIGDERSITPLRPLMMLAEDFISENGGEAGVDVKIISNIPRGAGLGSSAAVAAALVKALAGLVDVDVSNEEIKRWAMKSEEIIHDMPSGIDTHITTYGGVFTFQRPNLWEEITPRNMKLIIVDTGERRRTGKLVKYFTNFTLENPEVFREMRELYERLFEEAVKAYLSGDVKELGRLMTINGIMLKTAGVSTTMIDEIVKTSLENENVYGAKLTGAGGGGCVIALPKQDKAEETAEKLKRLFPRTWVSTFPHEGARLEMVK